MQITLKTLTLQNFKGVKQMEVEFNHTTNIYGRNKAGKTTLFDSFIWLLFGKDSTGSSDFSIKTLDESGNAIPQIDHTVTATMIVDGTEVKLQRVFREKWTRRRGSEESELTGHESLFYWNEVPLQAGEYKTKVSSLVDEGLFKLLTSSTAFTLLPWQKRREVLIQIAGDITDADILSGLSKAHVKELTELLNSGKPLSDLKKEIAMRKKKLMDDIKLIPSRIDEVKRGTPEPVDFEQVKKDIYAKQTALLEIENAITDKVTAYDEQSKLTQGKQAEIFNLKKRMQQIEFDAKSASQSQANDRAYQINDLKQKGASLVRSLNDYKADLVNIAKRWDETQNKITTLRTEWVKVSEEVLSFNEGEFVCPTCKRELDPATISTRQDIMTADFEKNKTARLTQIQSNGKSLSAALTEIETEATTCETFITDTQVKIDAMAIQVREAEAAPVNTSEPILPQEYHDIKKQADTLELSVMSVPVPDIMGMKQQKGTLHAEIDSLKLSLTAEDQIKKANTRVKELMTEEKNLAQQISILEKQEFAMSAFEHGQMNMVETRINNKFETVKFRLFNTLINGGTELCCDILVDGVPIGDANGAAKIQAGIEIINVLSDHYGAYLPCFSDNSESVNTMPEMKSQHICLYVSTDDKLVIK